jgi:hypothetical protein
MRLEKKNVSLPAIKASHAGRIGLWGKIDWI